MMNRKINFRVWDKEREGFLHKVDIDSDIIYADTKWYIHGGHALDDNYVMQQYTGLKDKNGKEIYEGDIITTYIKRWDSNEEKYCLVNDKFTGSPELKIGHVWYANPCEYIAEWAVSFNHLYSEDSIPYSKTQSVEIIGNIYETPELLKQ